MTWMRDTILGAVASGDRVCLGFGEPLIPGVPESLAVACVHIVVFVGEGQRGCYV